MNNTESKIVLATIESIEEFGLQCTTTRIIAKKANVNVASINYYFRNKDNLIIVALNKALENAFSEDVFESIDLKTSPRQEIVKEMFTFLLTGAFEFPNITKAFFYNTFTDETSLSMNLTKLNDFLKVMSKKILILYPELQLKDVELNVSQCMSLLLFNVLFPKTFKNLSHLDFKEKEEQKIFVNHFVSKYFNK